MYSSEGPNHILHIDGYDKLKPYGFAIHGAIDGYSRKIMWLRILRSNNNPYVISRLYFDYISEQTRLPKIVRSDAGNENVVVADIHRVLRSFHDDSFSGENSYMIGRSAANQRIEMLWSSLMKHFTQQWRNLFKDMVDSGLLNTADTDDIEILRLWFTYLLQQNLNTFKDYWNTHRIRRQRNLDVTTGVQPDVLIFQPELFGTTDRSVHLPISLNDITQLARQLSIEEPQSGCSDEFVDRVLTLSGVSRENLVQPTNAHDALQLFY